MKKSILFILALAIVLGAGYYVFSRGPSAGINPSAPVTEISAYSLDGQVLAITADKITVAVGKVEQTANGDVFVTSQKEFALAPQVSFIEGTKTKNVAAAALATNLSVKDRAVFTGFGTTSPWSGGTFTVKKIEILNRVTPIPAPKGSPVLR